jgi:DNA (cytosine-5)-methyltransferase 1
MAADLDKVAVATYRANHPDTRTVMADVADVIAIDIADACAGQELDLLAGGPSCQGYSTIGKRKEDDPRNYLFEHFRRLVKELRPRWLLLENVPGLLTYRNGHFKRFIADAFLSIGYSVTTTVLCAADYGVPQLRRRIFFLGSRDDAIVTFPKPSHCASESLFADGLLPYVTVQEAIGDLPPLNTDTPADELDYLGSPQSDFQRYARRYSRRLTLHQANTVSAEQSRIVRFIKEGYGLRSVPVPHLPERFHRMRRISNGQLRRDCTTLYHRLARNRPAYTITCFFRNIASGPFLHPLEDRSLSYREAARLMSFQDHYKFLGPCLARQIGNAVPPLLAKAIGRHLLELSGERGSNDANAPNHTARKAERHAEVHPA